jgi:hypothetical protein
MADGMREAASIFARRMARQQFGSRGDARTVLQGAHAQDGSLAEFSAFCGITRGNETTGRNFNFTVFSL